MSKFVVTGEGYLPESYSSEHHTPINEVGPFYISKIKRKAGLVDVSNRHSPNFVIPAPGRVSFSVVLTPEGAFNDELLSKAMKEGKRVFLSIED